jgi:hypothetical protein
MTGDDSYHAHCFKCKHCRNRIDELMFAKTSNGIYCMGCHHQRVARSRRHAQKKEREREEKERALPASPRPRQESVRGNEIWPSATLANTPNFRQDVSAPARESPPSAPPSANPSGRRPSVDTSRTSSAGNIPREDRHSPYAATPNAAGSPIYDRFINLRSSGSRPSSPAIAASSSESAAEPSARPHPADAARNGHLSTPGSAKELRSQASYDDGIRSVFKKAAAANGDVAASATSNSLSLPSGKGRASKRNSINPAMQFDIAAAVAEFGQLASAASAGSSVNSRTSHDSPSPASGRASPNGLSALQTRPRAESTPKPATETQADFPARPILSPSVTLDRVPQRKEPTDLFAAASVAASASASAQPAASARTLGLPPAVLRTQRSFDQRPTAARPNGHRAGGLSIDVEKSRGGVRDGRTSPAYNNAASPSHRIDVPHGIESGTDTDPENDGEAPAPPPKMSAPVLPPPRPETPEGAPRSADMRTPRPNGTHSPASAVDADMSVAADTTVGEEQVHARHSTFIAPALPPIRISLGAGDFSDFLRSYNDPRASASMPPLAELSPTQEGGVSPTQQEGEHSPDPAHSTASGGSWDRVLASEASASGTDSALTTPAEPTFFKDDAASVSTIGAGTTVPPEPRIADGGVDAFPTYQGGPLDMLPDGGAAAANDGGKARERLESTASLSGVRVARGDPSDLITRRLRSALAEAGRRGVAHVNLDHDFVQAIVLVLEQRRSDSEQMRGRLDLMRRASQQYVDGLSAAQGEYEEELRARRFAETEVTRLRVLLNDQAARISAMSADARRGDLHRQLSRELAENLGVLERNMSRLRVERDMTLAEVEELESSKRSVFVDVLSFWRC